MHDKNILSFLAPSLSLISSSFAGSTFLELLTNQQPPILAVWWQSKGRPSPNGLWKIDNAFDNAEGVQAAALYKERREDQEVE